MTINNLIIQLRRAPTSIEFEQVMQLIREYYDYTMTDFTNGELLNEAGSNEGSCKIFYFAQLNGLSKLETLSLFGAYYRNDVLANPAGTDHSNIRQFMLTGWSEITFTSAALTEVIE